MGSDSVPAPVTTAGRAGLDAILARPERAVVAVDFDGTLAPIVPDPDQSRAHPDAAAVLARLAPRLRAFAVITGRPAELAVRYAGLADLPATANVVVLGAYGAERWDAASGEFRTPPPHPGIEAVRAELPGLLAGDGGTGGPDGMPPEGARPEGVHVEDKGRALAVHTRRATDPEAALAALRAPLEALAERHGLTVEPGRLVLELRPPGMDKGIALTELVRSLDAEAVLYAGDDLGDLAAFAAVEALRAEGLGGVLVCSGSDEVTELAARADLVVDGPAGVVRLLASLADAVVGGGAETG